MTGVLLVVGAQESLRQRIRGDRVARWCPALHHVWRHHLYTIDRESALVRMFDNDNRELPLLAAIRHALVSYFVNGDNWSEGPERLRLHLLLSEPSTQATAVLRTAEAVDTLSGHLAARNERPSLTFRTQVTAGALAGAVLSAVRVWYAEGAPDPLPDLLDRTLATLQEGVDLACSEPQLPNLQPLALRWSRSCRATCPISASVSG